MRCARCRWGIKPSGKALARRGICVSAITAASGLILTRSGGSHDVHRDEASCACAGYGSRPQGLISSPSLQNRVRAAGKSMPFLHVIPAEARIHDGSNGPVCDERPRRVVGIHEGSVHTTITSKQSQIAWEKFPGKS